MATGTQSVSQPSSATNSRFRAATSLEPLAHVHAKVDMHHPRSCPSHRAPTEKSCFFESACFIQRPDAGSLNGMNRRLRFHPFGGKRGNEPCGRSWLKLCSRRGCSGWRGQGERSKGIGELSLPPRYVPLTG